MIGARHVLVRHAPLPGMAGVCYGHLDVDVDDAVHAAAADALHAQLPDWPIATSPSARCLRLATALQQRRPSTPAVVVDPRLREMHFGDWEGRAWADLPREALGAWAADVLHFAPPNGESFATFTHRAAVALDALPTSHIVIAHAGTVRAWLLARGMPAERAAGAAIAHLQPIALL